MMWRRDCIWREVVLEVVGFNAFRGEGVEGKIKSKKMEKRNIKNN
jgi:hypothetical protein